MGKIILLLVCFISFSLSAQQVHPDGKLTRPFSGRVVGVTDGDSIDVLVKGKSLKVRLAHIDAPEKRKSQPFAQQSKQALAALCFGKEVQVIPSGYDRYRRLIAVIITPEKSNANLEMIRQGMAWHYKIYSSDECYAEAESLARQNKKGLWAEKQPIPPWTWRKPKRIF